jgi:hypothetical protein
LPQRTYPRWHLQRREMKFLHYLQPSIDDRSCSRIETILMLEFENKKESGS